MTNITDWLHMFSKLHDRDKFFLGGGLCSMKGDEIPLEKLQKAGFMAGTLVNAFVLLKSCLRCDLCRCSIWYSSFPYSNEPYRQRFPRNYRVVCLLNRLRWTRFTKMTISHGRKSFRMKVSNGVWDWPW